MRIDETVLTRAFTHLGQALGLDWAQSTAARITTGDPWERLLIAGLARDFQQLRLEFLARTKNKDPQAAVNAWLDENRARVAQFAGLIARARLQNRWFQVYRSVRRARRTRDRQGTLKKRAA